MAKNSPYTIATRRNIFTILVWYFLGIFLIFSGSYVFEFDFYKNGTAFVAMTTLVLVDLFFLSKIAATLLRPQKSSKFLLLWFISGKFIALGLVVGFIAISQGKPTLGIMLGALTLFFVPMAVGLIEALSTE